MSFETKASGSQDEFASGAHRDKSTGKPRYDLLSLKALRRWADLMGRGAVHYGARNWELGMPRSRFAESGLRHFFQLMEGDVSEDHAAAVLFNVAAMIHFEGTEWDDINEQPDEWTSDGSVSLKGLTYKDLADICNPAIQPECEPYEQLELPFDIVAGEAYDEDTTTWATIENSINWTQMKYDVEAGKLDGSTVNWPSWFKAPQG